MDEEENVMFSIGTIKLLESSIPLNTFLSNTKIIEPIDKLPLHK
jgi:hypothetical protein